MVTQIACVASVSIRAELKHRAARRSFRVREARPFCSRPIFRASRTRKLLLAARYLSSARMGTLATQAITQIKQQNKHGRCHSASSETKLIETEQNQATNSVQGFCYSLRSSSFRVERRLFFRTAADSYRIKLGPLHSTNSP